MIASVHAALAVIRDHALHEGRSEPQLIFLGDLFDDEGFGLEVLLRIFELIVDAPERIESGGGAAVVRNRVERAPARCGIEMRVDGRDVGVEAPQVEEAQAPGPVEAAEDGSRPAAERTAAVVDHAQAAAIGEAFETACGRLLTDGIDIYDVGGI